MGAKISEKVLQLEERLRAYARLVVAYSGGVDSTCLLAVARRNLGDSVLGVIADSPSLPRRALADALTVARSLGAPVEVIATHEFDNELYTGNPPNRCYYQGGAVCDDEWIGARAGILHSCLWRERG